MRLRSKRLGWFATVAAAAAIALLAAPSAAVAGNTAYAGGGGGSWGKVLVFAVQPTTTQVNTAMTPAVTVDVQFRNGQLDRYYNGPVRLTYVVNPVDAPEPSGNVVRAVHGVATFPDLTFGAVGFGFELKAAIPWAASAPSQPFDIVGQLVHCQAGQSCHTQTVSSDGTSGSATAAAGATADVLTATGGGFPSLSCTTYGGVVSFTVTSRAKLITVTLAGSAIGHGSWWRPRSFGICWGSPTPFITKNGEPAQFNPVNDEYEGLLPRCRPHGPSPCILVQRRGYRGAVITLIAAPAGDPHITY
jgi:hypothetical protein